MPKRPKFDLHGAIKAADQACEPKESTRQFVKRKFGGEYDIYMRKKGGKKVDMYERI